MAESTITMDDVRRLAARLGPAARATGRSQVLTVTDDRGAVVLEGRLDGPGPLPPLPPLPGADPAGGGHARFAICESGQGRWVVFHGAGDLVAGAGIVGAIGMATGHRPG